MEERLFSEFWKVVQGKLHSDAARALREYFPKLEASLKALDLTSAYWSWSSSHSQTHLLLCGAMGFGRMEIEMQSAQTPENTWSHTISLSVLPWSEVTEIKQNFSRGGHSGDDPPGQLSEAVLSIRSGSPISLLPAPNMDRRGGVCVADNKVESFTDQTVFVAAVIKGQRGRGAEGWERGGTG